MQFPPLPVMGGGQQIGDGGIEAKMGVQAEPVTLTGAAVLTAAQLLNGLVIYNSSSAGNLQLPTAATLDAALSAAKVNSSIEFVVVATGSGTGTITTNTGWTLVGNMAVATTVAKRFRARKTGVGAWTLYQIA